MKTLADRFWSKVNKLGPDECWEWTAFLFKGYGKISVDGAPKLAHRVSYEMVHGAIPEGLFACHRCDNRKCVNPAHIFIGEAVDNIMDMHDKGRAVYPPRKAGKDHGMCKLKPEEVAEIRAFKGFSQRELARLFGVGQSQIHRIRAGESWSHLEKQ